MKDFLKIVFGSAIGFVIASLVFTFITILFVVAAVSMLPGRDTFVLQHNSVLHLRLSGNIVERTPEIDPISLLFSDREVATTGLNDIISAIRKAKENDRIKGIYLESRTFSASMATLSEIRQELIRFQESGKFIIAYADNFSQGGYYLASVADKIVINPQGMLELRGLVSALVFFSDALDNLGIDMQIIRVGEYKSASEPFTRMSMSAENREQMTELLEDAWSFIRNRIAQSRSLTPERIDELADKMILFQPVEFLLAENLVDATKYEAEMRNYLRARLNIDANEPISVATVADMRSVDAPRSLTRRTTSNNTIAMLYMTGNITSGSGSQGIQDRFKINQIERLRRDENVKAVVIRINSGGGSAYASEQIWRAVSDLAAEKPVVVSMGDVAASGGFYIAAAANKIVAQPNTITGSIGVFSMIPNFEGTTRRLGVATDVVKTNRFADFGDVTRALNPDERQMFQAMTYRVHNLFLRRAAEGRGMTIEEVDKIAGGRVWTGNQAKQHGLVDELGGIARAIELAAEMADLGENFRVYEFPRMRSPLEELFNRDREGLVVSALREYVGNNLDLLMMLRDVQNEDFIQARMPFELNIR